MRSDPTSELPPTLDAADRSARLFSRLPEPSARDELMRHYHPLAEFLARRFRPQGGDERDDLVQVAAIGLLKAIDRFEPGRGIKFSTYAVPTITGELKRHLRDSGWSMHLPRRLQERCLLLRMMLPEIQQELGRSPNVGEIADRVGLSREDVVEALEGDGVQTLRSLDAVVDDGGSNPKDHLGVEDEALAVADGWSSIAPVLRRLPDRERRLLFLRFVRGMSQSEIADILGVSQMHVSRLLAGTLRKVRESVDARARV